MKNRNNAVTGEEALLVEKNLARNALMMGDRDAAWNHLRRVTDRLLALPESPERDGMLISGVIELANVSFVLGRGFPELTVILQRALPAAERIGDRRSMAMINLHLGRLFYFAEQRDTAISVFEVGKFEAEALGDEDILTQAAEFIGLYYFIQGRFREAIVYFERAAHSFESEIMGRVVNPSGPLWLSYCASFLGQFHRAIGTLDYYRRVAMAAGDKGLATTLRAVLGIILLGIRKTKQAHFHLSGALQEARLTRNALAGYFASGGLSTHHCLEGRMEEAHEWIMKATEEAKNAGLIRQYASPVILETLFAIFRNGTYQTSSLNYADEFMRIMQEPNIHLKGVALRLRAVEQIDNGVPVPVIESGLKQSEAFLMQSGDPVQTGKTRIEMARLRLRDGDREGARALVEKARRDFSNFTDVFFPDDLRPLLAARDDLKTFDGVEDPLLGMFSDVIAELSPSADFDSLLAKTVRSTNRYFGAERGGIFWFRHGSPGKGMVLKGACNLSQADINAPAFRENLTLVFRTFYENRPQILRRRDTELNPSLAKALICVPFEVGGQVRGVLYHDNSYVQDCFDNLSNAQLMQMTRWLTSYIDHIHDFSRQLEQKSADWLGHLKPDDGESILTCSPFMMKILEQADRIAVTDSTVLILGETGTGKELLARRIHRMSRRSGNPMITVDPTVIPEALVESELFGHEKGAFTGADRQKKGRMELAHKGTLFIDEVGEIPKTIQVKLLRAIQEKTMTRIGGTQNITSDFRLIGATNRNLAAEVAAGRFREDLYYRLNVIPVMLPPLRERKEDIVLLAGHFLQRLAQKYGHQELRLIPEHEAALREYTWPGNIRELRNVMERAVLLSTGNLLQLNLPSVAPPGSGGGEFDDLPTLDEIQRRYISYVMDKTGGRISGVGGASDILGMKRTSLYNRMNKLGLR